MTYKGEKHKHIVYLSSFLGNYCNALVKFAIINLIKISALIKRYCYEKGPIVLAQAGFGRQLLKPGSPLNGAWHMAERSLKSRFRAIDFIP